MGMLRNRLFFMMMGGGAALGLVRGFAVAAILSAAGFGIYATLLAVGVFLAPLFGFGQVELTRKIFPRLLVDGTASLIPSFSDAIAARLGGRIMGVTVFAAAACAMVGEAHYALAAIACALVAFGNAWSSILASALRASEEVLPLGEATLARSALTLALAVGGAYLLGMDGAIAGEALGAVFGGLILRLRLRMMTGPAPDEGAVSTSHGELGTARVSWDGMRIFAAAVAISVPVYLSRPVVGLLYSPEVLGTFSFLMLFVMMSVTLFGVTDQVVGPSLVRGQHKNDPLHSQIAYLFKISGALALLVGAGLTAVFFTIQFPPLAVFAQKYQYDPDLIVPIVVLAMTQLTSTFDWMLQAHDRERVVLNAALAGLSFFAIGLLAVSGLGLSLAAFVWIMAVARMFQLAIQIVAVVRLRE